MRPIVWDRQQKKRLQHPGDRDRRHETRGGVVFTVNCPLFVSCVPEKIVLQVAACH